MVEEGRERGLDGPAGKQDRSPTRTIGILGNTQLTLQERERLFHLGRLIASLHKILYYIPTRGTTEAVQKGIESGNGISEVLTQGIIDSADHTLIYAPDDALLTRLENAYPDFWESPKITVIAKSELGAWVKALETVAESIR